MTSPPPSFPGFEPGGAPDLTKGITVEFLVKSEPWVRYKLEDHTLLFGRLILTKVIRTQHYDPTGQPIYVPSSQNLFSTICPEEIKGTPSILTAAPLDPRTLKTIPIEFDRLGAEEWNVYPLSDESLLRIKLEVTSVQRTDKYGPDGDPYYIIHSQPVTRIKVSPELVRKQLPKLAVEPKGIYG